MLKSVKKEKNRLMSNTETKNTQKGWPRNDGRTVPAGYFDDFNRRMMAQIPQEVPVVAAEKKRTTWQIIRPYAYMAAMFAGVYLMMNIFSLTTGIRDAVAPTESSALFADLMSTGTTSYVDDYATFDDPYIYEDLYEAGYEIPENL